MCHNRGLIDFSFPSRQPTRRERGLFQGWVKYLKNSRLTKEEIYRRAAYYTSQKRRAPEND